MNKKLVSLLAAAVMTTGTSAAAIVPSVMAADTAAVTASAEAGFTDQYVNVKKSYAASAKAIRIYWE